RQFARGGADQPRHGQPDAGDRGGVRHRNPAKRHDARQFRHRRRDLELYVPAGVELSDIRLSPLCAEEFAGLPPAFIHTGQFDPFSDEGEEYAQRLGGFGVTVHGRAHPGMIHYFYCMPRIIPYALEAMRIIGSEIRYAVDLPQAERRFHRRIRPELIRA
ncbi:MAG TPA: alpha/beta hydrolase fold domain-containing protein, partial [Rhizomicrobium sp.]|nr:alpha/beta hydrolase fold domain-containing protein [Rhizomicrobium sp.]